MGRIGSIPPLSIRRSRKSVLKKAYENVVNIVTKLLENRQRKEVATVVELSGRIENPSSNLFQIIGGLIENAFFQATRCRAASRRPEKGDFAPSRGDRLQSSSGWFPKTTTVSGTRAKAGKGRRTASIVKRRRLEDQLRESLDVARRTEEALRESEQRFRALASSAPSCVWTADPDGVITFANDQWYRFTGLTPEETARDWIRVIHPDDGERCATQWRRALETGQNYAIEVRNRRSDGEYRWFLTLATPMRDAEGRIVGWVGTSTDISEQKRAEQALREADRRKDEFLAMLAHELRNPLGAITTAVQLLRQLVPSDANQHWAREVVERQVQHLGRIVDDLSDVSRISQGKIDLKKEKVAVAAAVALALDAVRPLIEVRKQELILSLSPRQIHVDADPNRLAQIVGNLLNNASKYSGEGRRIWLSLQREEDDAVIHVRDEGIGISPDILPRIFEPFYQIDRSLGRSQGGLGIGLTLVRSLAELHGGMVAAFSAGVGFGSEFIVRLPALPARADDAKDSVEDGKASACGRRVLVVDDDRDSAEGLARLLELTGHQVRTAYDGPTALETASTFRPEIVILDIGLPLMDGYEVARRLRRQTGSENTVLVALTGYGQEEDRKATRDAGFDHHVVKPVRADALLTLLEPSRPS